MSILYLPNSLIADELSKKSLFNYIKRNSLLNQYLPEDIKEPEINRNFILNVKITFLKKDCI